MESRFDELNVQSYRITYPFGIASDKYNCSQVKPLFDNISKFFNKRTDSVKQGDLEKLQIVPSPLSLLPHNNDNFSP
jgi:hypothetical protein